MTTIHRYQIAAAAAAILFLLYVPGEAIDRWGEVGRLAQELEAEEDQTPEKLHAKAVELRARETTLASMLTSDSSVFEQSRTGVIELLNATARHSGVVFESFSPVESEGSGQIQEVGFKLHFGAELHKVGRFLSELESGALMVRIRSLELSRSPRNKLELSAALEGAAYIIPRKVLK